MFGEECTEIPGNLRTEFNPASRASGTQDSGACKAVALISPSLRGYLVSSPCFLRHSCSTSGQQYLLQSVLGCPAQTSDAFLTRPSQHSPKSLRMIANSPQGERDCSHDGRERGPVSHEKLARTTAWLVGDMEQTFQEGTLPVFPLISFRSE